MNAYDQEQSDKYCLFRCVGETFCIPALAVRHVVPQSDVTRIPLSTGTLVGLVKIQRELVTLFSLEQIYDLPQKSNSGNQKVLVINRDTRCWGLLIDEIETLAELEISICPQSTTNEQPHFVIGSASYRDEFVSVIDPDNLYAILTGQLLQYWDNYSAALLTQDAEESQLTVN